MTFATVTKLLKVCMAEVILICSVKHEIKNNLLLKTKEESKIKGCSPVTRRK